MGQFNENPFHQANKPSFSINRYTDLVAGQKSSVYTLNGNWKTWYGLFKLRKPITQQFHFDIQIYFFTLKLVNKTRARFPKLGVLDKKKKNLQLYLI